MGKRTRGLAVLGVLVITGWLCAGVAAAAAPSINVGTGNGPSPGTATFSVTLSSGTAAVAGAMNDIAFDPHTPVAVASGGRCLITTSTSCTSDAQCPALLPNPPYTVNEPCVDRTGQPDCTVNSAIGKQALFSFQPTTPGSACSGASCTGIRAVVFAVGNVTAIPDGSTLYTCNVSIAAGTANADYPLTISGVSMGDTNHPSNPVAGATGTSGKITVGPASSYAVCDVVPFTGDNAGQFGDKSIDIFDVRAIFAAAQLGVDLPADGSARFSAMDAVTLDSPTTCGGDATLDIFDVRQCFAVGQLGVTNYVRTGTGASCTSAVQPQ